VGILGILKAGGAYLPIDPTYPPERIRYMIEDSGLGLLLVDDTTARVFGHQASVRSGQPEDGGQTLDVGHWTSGNQPFDVLRISDDTIYASYPDTNPDVPITPDNLAYVIYTSGSTGRPKGTLLSHRGLGNLADVHHREFEMTEGKRVMQFSPFSFDASVWETVMALRNGAALVLAPQETLASGPDLLRLMKEQRITTVTLPPSLLAVLEPDDLPDLHTVIAAGEACTNEIVRKWAPGRNFFNAYGPTETTVCASMHRVDPEARYEVGPPIGKPISNFQLYVVDKYLNPQPVGVPGELLIGGVGLARGYLNRPDLTAEKFIPNPFARDDRRRTREGRPAFAQGASSRLYRTGDLVKYLPNGDIEFLGRIDHQVKVRGFRIELGEIEARLRQFPGLQDSVVIVREDKPGDKRIVAYFVPEPGVEVNPHELRQFMREVLPEYMVPSFFVQLEAMPLTPSNKIDRKALPAPDASVLAPTKEYIPPTTETEVKLAGIVAELLHIERVGLADNFFELGGHSLLATQFISRVRDVFGVEMPLRALFEHPTIGEFAMQLDIERAKGVKTAARPAIKRRDRAARRVRRSDLGPNRDNHS
jgi:amino acid adenylation domain-containing protein